jgi:membrane protein
MPMKFLFKLLWRYRRLVYLVFAATLIRKPSPALDKMWNGQTTSPSKEPAEAPQDLSKTGWKLVLKRTKEALKDKDLATSAAALAYYATLSFFPILIGVASVYLLFSSPASLLHAIDNLSLILPDAVARLLKAQLSPIARTSNKHAWYAAIISILALLWTTSGGIQNLVKATNKTYEAKESRGFLRLRLTSIGLSGLFLVVGSLILSVLLLSGDALKHWGFPHVLAVSFPIIRWPILVVLVSVFLSAIYKYAPDRKDPKWQWVSWGATAATVIWLAASALFFYYAQNFANFNKSYGTFAGIIVLMTWFNISSLIILLGAQVNKKLEETTSADTSED